MSAGPAPAKSGAGDDKLADAMAGFKLPALDSGVLVDAPPELKHIVSDAYMLLGKHGYNSMRAFVRIVYDRVTDGLEPNANGDYVIESAGINRDLFETCFEQSSLEHEVGELSRHARPVTQPQETVEAVYFGDDSDDEYNASYDVLMPHVAAEPDHYQKAAKITLGKLSHKVLWKTNAPHFRAVALAHWCADNLAWCFEGLSRVMELQAPDLYTNGRASADQTQRWQ
jgi:hypothetical protein